MSYYPVHHTTVVVPAHRCSTAHVVTAWILTFLTSLYLLPWAIGATRSKANLGAIVLVNVLLGWTVVGWIIALVMACLSDPAVRVHHTQVMAPFPVHAPYGSPVHLYPAAALPPAGGFGQHPLGIPERTLPPAPYAGPVPAAAPEPGAIEHTLIDPAPYEITQQLPPVDERDRWNVYRPQ